MGELRKIVSIDNEQLGRAGEITIVCGFVAMRETCYLELTRLYVVGWKGMLGGKCCCNCENELLLLPIRLLYTNVGCFL